MFGPQNSKFSYCITHLTLHESVTLKDSFKENLLEMWKGSASFRDRTRNYKPYYKLYKLYTELNFMNNSPNIPELLYKQGSLALVMFLNSGQVSWQFLRCVKTALRIDLTVFHQRRWSHSATAGEILLTAGSLNPYSEGMQLIIWTNIPL